MSADGMKVTFWLVVAAVIVTYCLCNGYIKVQLPSLFATAPSNEHVAHLRLPNRLR